MHTRPSSSAFPPMNKDTKRKSPPQPSASCCPLCSPLSAPGCLPLAAHPPPQTLMAPLCSDVVLVSASLASSPSPLLPLGTPACLSSSHTPSSFLPLGLCACCFLFPERPFSSSLHDRLLLNVQCWVEMTLLGGTPGHPTQSPFYFYPLVLFICVVAPGTFISEFICMLTCFLSEQNSVA